MDERTLECRRLQNEELYDMRSSTNVIRMIKSRIMRLVGHLARISEKEGARRLFIGEPVGKRSLGRPRCRREDNIKMDPQGVRKEC
jgi:hypothetical protein